MSIQFELDAVLAGPWIQLTDSGDKLLIEAYKEIHSDHVLFELKLKPLAKKNGTDDVLFFVEELNQFAIVHLTWSGQKEDGVWPGTDIYSNFDSLRKRIQDDVNEQG